MTPAPNAHLKTKHMSVPIPPATYPPTVVNHPPSILFHLLISVPTSTPAIIPGNIDLVLDDAPILFSSWISSLPVILSLPYLSLLLQWSHLDSNYTITTNCIIPRIFTSSFPLDCYHWFRFLFSFFFFFSLSLSLSPSPSSLVKILLFNPIKNCKSLTFFFFKCLIP